jgi:hypothetical protein
MLIGFLCLGILNNYMRSYISRVKFLRSDLPSEQFVCYINIMYSTHLIIIFGLCFSKLIIVVLFVFSDLLFLLFVVCIVDMQFR